MFNNGDDIVLGACLLIMVIMVQDTKLFNHGDENWVTCLLVNRDNGRVTCLLMIARIMFVSHVVCL